MMKKFGLVLLFALFTTTATATTKIENVLDGYMSAWNSHDKAKVASYFSADVIWYDLTSDNKINGKENVAPAITAYFMGYVADMYWHKSGDVYVSGNTVIYEWVYGGTFNGNWGEQNIQNKQFSIKGISTTTINDHGEIIAQKDYYDMDSFKRAIGVVE